MTMLSLGLTLFIIIHLIPAAQSLRKGLVAAMGENAYKGVFAMFSLVAMVLIVLGMGSAEFVEIYTPPVWGRHATGVLMLFALICLVSFKMKSSIRRITAHPMSWGIVLWAAGHLFSNGDMASLALFGSFLVYSIIAMISGNMRGAHASSEASSLTQNAVVIAVSLTATVVLVYFHAMFAGVALM
ncbi:MAG: NnrU family protein [Mariprofundus sp.]